MTTRPYEEYDTNSKCFSGFDFEAKVYISKELMIALIPTIGLILTNLFFK
ncbi:MAG: hypothetical protein PHY47_21470 [Lachnospiraceae bacterium]|nr:hypothetical protein [Lachnospiraceae bacterium]